MIRNRRKRDRRDQRRCRRLGKDEDEDTVGCEEEMWTRTRSKSLRWRRRERGWE